MKKIQTVNMTMGELIDKITILVKKAEKCPNKLDEYNKIAQLGDITVNGEVLLDICELCLTNWKLWEYEAGIRKGMNGDISVEEAGKFALLSRKTNTKRVEIKNKINRYYGQIEEVKIYPQKRKK